MYPSHVRMRILEDHEALRRLLVELEDAVGAMLADQTCLPKVRELTQTVLCELTRHTKLEDEILAPVLLDIDAWGEIRAGNLLEHHRLQRAQVSELAGLCAPSIPASEAVHLAQALITDLRADMQHEEEEILRADLLRDDIIAFGNESS